MTNEELEQLEASEDSVSVNSHGMDLIHKEGLQIDPASPAEERLEKVKAARNALLEAAKPLLRVLSEMPRQLPEGDAVIHKFREVLDQEVRSFQTLCDKTSLRREHVLTARYCLCKIGRASCRERVSSPV